MRGLWMLCLLWLLPVVALADMVPEMPPLECAPGSVERSNHGSPYCEPMNCKSDKDCGEERVCQAQALCIYSTKYYTRPTGKEATRLSAAGVCSASQPCSLGTCETAKRCVLKASPTTRAPEETPESQPESAPQPERAPQPEAPGKVTPPGRCSVEAASSASGVGLWLLVLAVLRFARRREGAR